MLNEKQLSFLKNEFDVGKSDIEKMTVEHNGKKYVLGALNLEATKPLMPQKVILRNYLNAERLQ